MIGWRLSRSAGLSNTANHTVIRPGQVRGD